MGKLSYDRTHCFSFCRRLCRAFKRKCNARQCAINHIASFFSSTFSLGSYIGYNNAHFTRLDSNRTQWDTHTLCAGRKNVKEVETHEPPTVGSTTREGYPLLLTAAAIRLSDNSQNLASIGSSCFLIGVAVGYFHCWVTLGQVDRGVPLLVCNGTNTW